MASELRPALIVFLLLTIVTGLLYPGVVYLAGRLFFPQQASGSIIEQDGRAVGSRLFGQAFTSPQYFWSRPSATTPAYNGAASTGSNQATTNPALASAIKDRVAALRAADPGDLADDVVQTLEVLDVHRRVDVDAGVEQLLDVLPALGMARRRLAPRGVRVRKLVDEENLGPPAQRSVEIEFLLDDAAIADWQARQPLETFHQPLGLDPPVRLNVPDDDVGASRSRGACCLEHRVGLADAGCGAEKNAQPSAPRLCLFGLNAREQLIRVRPSFGHELSLMQRSLLQGIEGEIELYDIDARFAEHAKSTSLRGILHELADLRLLETARARHATHLVFGGRR